MERHPGLQAPVRRRQLKNKQRFLAILLITVPLLLCGCASSSEADTANLTDTRPAISQIRDICELAVLKCRYHNLAKSVKEPGSGIIHFGEKERKFWIEYQGTVEISYDVNKVTMKQNGTDIEITLPSPTLTCAVIPQSWNPESYIIEPDQWIQKNPITADDQDKAIASAQKEMEDQVKNNSSLLRTAQRQAQELIENYIGQIGDLTGTQYQVTWKTEDGISGSTESTETAVSR